MKSQLIRITLFFIVAAAIIMFISSKGLILKQEEDYYQEQLVDLNEIVQLSEKDDVTSNKKLDTAIDNFRAKLKNTQKSKDDQRLKNDIYFLFGIFTLFLGLVFTYIYFKILRPFDKLKNYADEIAKGNFDAALQYERTNYFGAFTWAFDHMRREITKARACEKEAIDNNKTVIATLSHDIKTPIASIRAYAEGLDANLDSGPEKRRKYISVIMNKCDEVTNLTNDLFLHSLSDLDKLKMNVNKEKLQDELLKILQELQMKDKDVLLLGSIPDVNVMIDAKRFEQVLDNLINNAEKYAQGSKIEISSERVEDQINISVRDYGNGIPDEDIPFIFDKFYRGRNVGDKQGTGLGLYIVKYIMEQMKGNVSLFNSPQGLKIILSLPIIS